MLLIFIGGVIGLLVGGFPGLIVGVGVGYLARWILRRALRRGLAKVQSQFLDSTFAVMGALCKADGAVSRDEIKAAEALFERLHLSPEQRESAKEAFERGKAPDFALDAEVRKLARLCRGRGPMLQTFLQLQLTAIAANGDVDPAEHEMLVRVARGLGLSENDVARLESLLRASTSGSSGKEQLDDAYAALGVSPSASDAQVKRAYRRLMSENHPDKLASKGLPETMREVAEEKTREIAAAYERIKVARQLA
ncbi:co-chaperone DjlA [Aquisalimonas sp. 2447]|uniref:co-chaperone DjlA n=1 Tax=Aquisalimonas sp. 2447 TaxID=2740807 RepID=UPI0014324E04|nr:co-chaperone DjlA [Aquisalimonas sp. 2447]QIT54476.1 co-chaperone DjlA [Aquisalimonas sp. 2447]